MPRQQSQLVLIAAPAHDNSCIVVLVHFAAMWDNTAVVGHSVQILPGGGTKVALGAGATCLKEG